MELIHLEVRQDVGLQLRGAAQGKAINFQQIGIGHGVFCGVKIAHVGQQETQGVANAAIGIDHTRQNFVIDVEVARVIGRGHPQAHNFCAHLVGNFLRRHHIAQALAHLAALTVGGKAMGQQTFVRRAIVECTTEQQRTVEPAAVLVVALQIQVGFWARVMERLAIVGIFVAAAQHVLKRRA